MLFWTLDVPASFFVAFYAEDGHLEDRPAAIALRYLKGWFVPDILLVCNDWLSTMFVMIEDGTKDSDKMSFFRMAKFARLGRNLRNLRLLRIAKLREILVMVHKSITSEALPWCPP